MSESQQTEQQASKGLKAQDDTQKVQNPFVGSDLTPADLIGKTIWIHSAEKSKMGEYDALLFKFSDEEDSEIRTFITSSKVMRDQWDNLPLTQKFPFPTVCQKVKNYFCFGGDSK